MRLLSLLVDIFMLGGILMLGTAAFLIGTVVGFIYAGCVCIGIAILLKNLIEEAQQ